MSDVLTIVLLVINIFVAILLTGAVLLQKSEGGALGMGGGPSNSFMSARGTGDLLTRITWILFAVFLVISITLTLLAAAQRQPQLGRGLKLDPNEVTRPKAPADPNAPALPEGITLPPATPGTAPSQGAAPGVDVFAPQVPAAPAETAPEKK
ncbi:MAG TPA: preprotein translocase subunit SecG [Caulobacter sp.]|nr:preprotein translocase subunit SecG [Caulobacter sp.]